MTRTTADKAKAGKRKGTRSVSTLTPSQLARKRANDREAQRAIRARTKEHIENLEREIDELRSQQSRDQTVRDLLGRNRALEEEVKQLRESLGIRTARSGLSYPNFSSPSSPAAPEDYGNNYFTPNTSSTILERSSMPPTIHSPAASCITNSDIGFDDVKSDRHRAHLSNVPPTTVERVPGVLLSIHGNNSAQHPRPSYPEVLVLTSDTSCQDDALIAGYIADCQRLTDLAGGQPHREVILGPHRPNVRPLLSAHRHLLGSLGLPGPQTQAAPGYPLLNIATSIFNVNNLELPLERVGSFLVFRALIAWLVQPTRDTFIGLREILSPQPNQQTIPHPQWMDFIFWPHLRSAIIERQAIYNTPEFRRVYCTNLRLKNWPVAITEAFTVDFSTGSVYATHEFSEHIWDLRNWGMHENFTRRYPELEPFLGRGWLA
ncbi:hypothetical protein CHU98_g1997 [Xylaria longipes]|nr:hypothetical protein CHU98_g1997 [Xylaria longipes]